MTTAPLPTRGVAAFDFPDVPDVPGKLRDLLGSAGDAVNPLPELLEASKTAIVVGALLVLGSCLIVVGAWRVVA